MKYDNVHTLLLYPFYYNLSILGGTTFHYKVGKVQIVDDVMVNFDDVFAMIHFQCLYVKSSLLR